MEKSLATKAKCDLTKNATTTRLYDNVYFEYEFISIIVDLCK